MKNNKILKISKMLIIAFLLLLTPVIAYADEVNNDMEEKTTGTIESSEKGSGTELINDNKENNAEKSKTEDQVDKAEQTALTTTSEPQSNQNNGQNDDKNEKKSTTVEQTIETHKVAVITTKVDENGNPLKGALLQILDSEGNVVDEWISDGTEHESMLPEGNYVLHEKQAPKGYKLAPNKTFTVKVEMKDINASVVHDDSHDVCWHYQGVPLFYIESNGEREEVYCVNQGWEEPHDVSYDGVVLTAENIKSFMPDADPTMTAEELYNKVLDIIYHRTKTEEVFQDLTETEIRMITEYALKNYTSTLYNNGTWARYYAYSEESPDGYIIDPDNGSTLGKLAQHWKSKYPVYGHGEKLPKIYADFYYYLISDKDHHPADLHLYLYSTESANEDGPYQNLLSVKWFNPYDENHTVNLTLTNEKTPESPKKTKKKLKKASIVVNPQTGDSIITYIVTLTVSLSALAGATTRRKEY